MELKIRDEENQQISTEMHIQYSRISDENRSLKEDNLHPVSVRNISKAIDNGSADSRDFLESMMPWSQEYREYEEKTRQIAMNSFKNLFQEPVKPKAPLKRKQDAVSRKVRLDNTA